MDRGAYRERAESFLSEFGDEYHSHFAGLKPDYAVEQIYARHASLFTSETVSELRAETAAAEPGSEEHRRLRMLLLFAAESHLGAVTKDLDAELARREALLSIEASGEVLGFRAAAAAQANEPDRSRRAAIEQARLDATARELNPIYRERLDRADAATRSLGWPSQVAMWTELRGVDLAALRDQTAAFVARTDDFYRTLLEPELQATTGAGFAALDRADLPRFFRAADLDDVYAAGALIDALSATLAVAGIDARSQPGVLLDVDARPTKSPRAFCSPVRVPGDVRLVIAPAGGRDDYQSLMHEAGHTEHYAHIDPGLAFEFRWLGDNAITECQAFLLQHLVDDPAWLERKLGAVPDRAAAIARRGRAERLVYLRRYAGKLAYELQLHSGACAPESLGGRYADALGGAVGIAWPSEPYLADVDPGFYCSCYLRAWTLETHLREHLRAAHGEAWFDRRAAWDELRTVWAEGQRLTPEELLGRLSGGERLDFGVLVEDLGL